MASGGGKDITVAGGNRRSYVIALVEVVRSTLEGREVAASVRTAVVTKARGGRRREVPEVAFLRCLSAPVPLRKENRNGDGGQNPDYDHDYIVATLQTHLGFASAPC